MEMPIHESIRRMRLHNALSLPWFLKKLAIILGFPIAEPIPITVRR